MYKPNLLNCMNSTYFIECQQCSNCDPKSMITKSEY